MKAPTSEPITAEKALIQAVSILKKEHVHVALSNSAAEAVDECWTQN